MGINISKKNNSKTIMINIGIIDELKNRLVVHL